MLTPNLKQPTLMVSASPLTFFPKSTGSAEEADRAIQLMNQATLNGRLLVVLKELEDKIESPDHHCNSPSTAYER